MSQPSPAPLSRLSGELQTLCRKLINSFGIFNVFPSTFSTLLIQENIAYVMVVPLFLPWQWHPHLHPAVCGHAWMMRKSDGGFAL